MRYVVLGLLLAACLLFPHAAVLTAAPVLAAARWVAAQPLVWAFVAGIAARPRLARRLGAPTRRNTP
jgi:hypothetical protein